MDPADRQKYDARVKEWTEKHDEFLSEHPYLRKNPKRLAPGFTGNGKPEVSYGSYPRNWKPLGEVSKEEILKGCNPEFDPKMPDYLEGSRYDYSNNCTNCVVAYDLRCRGENVTAQSLGDCGTLRTKMFTAWKGGSPIEAQGDFFYEITDYLNQYDDSIRIAVGADRKRNPFDRNSFKGHAFIIEKRFGEVVVIDPQTGRIYNKENEIREYFRPFVHFDYMRVDNLEVSDRGISACKAVTK